MYEHTDMDQDTHTSTKSVSVCSFGSYHDRWITGIPINLSTKRLNPEPLKGPMEFLPKRLEAHLFKSLFIYLKTI